MTKGVIDKELQCGFIVLYIDPRPSRQSRDAPV